MEVFFCTSLTVCNAEPDHQTELEFNNCLVTVSYYVAPPGPLGLGMEALKVCKSQRGSFIAHNPPCGIGEALRMDAKCDEKGKGYRHQRGRGVREGVGEGWERGYAAGMGLEGMQRR